MRIIFCADPLDNRSPDSMYLSEVEAVKRLSIPYSIIDLESLVNENNALKAVRRVEQEAEVVKGVYRGWMLKPAQYATLYDALLNLGIRLINDPASYQHCHYLPESYPVITANTPRSVWYPIEDGLDIDRVMEMLRPFGISPILVKDYVKSQKHYWLEACFISSAADQEQVERVVKRFLELQGNDLNVGLVFREFLELEPLGSHAKSGMPLTREYRLFFLDGNPISTANYWSNVDYGSTALPIERFTEIARQVQSRFFTMDIAKRMNGDWIIVELGDGQVAGLPDSTNIDAFYTTIKTALT